MGRVLRTTLPTGKGGVVHLFVVCGCQGAEEDADQFLLTDKLLQADMALAYSLGAGLTPNSLSVVLMRWLLQMLVLLLIGGSPPHFLCLFLY